MHKILLVLLLFCSKSTEVHAQNDFNDKIYSLILDFQNKENFAGMGLLYYSNNYGKRSFAIGQSDVEKNITMDTTSVYDIGSTTKIFISILIQQLKDEGKLSMESPVNNWCDNITNGSHISIAHLLNHIGGLNDYLSNSKFLDEYYSSSEYNYTLNDLINAGLKDTSNIVPGIWKYSNTNYLILGKIIERITANSVGQELKQRIFDEAGMANTYYMPECNMEEINNLVTGYQFGHSMKTNQNYFLYNAAGGIVSTLDDMCRFAQWLMNSKYLNNMISDPEKCKIENSLTTKYGQGIIIADNIFNTTMFGHGGTSFGFKSEFWFSTETDEIIIYFVNDYMHQKNYGKFRKKLEKVIQSCRQ